MAAEGTLQRTTDWPEDAARRSFAAVRCLPLPGVSVGSVWSTCLGLVGIARSELEAAIGATVTRCGCPAGECRLHGWALPATARRALLSTLSLETDLFATPGDVDARILQWYTTYPNGVLAGALGTPWETPWGGMFALCAPRVTTESLRHWHGRIRDLAHRSLSSPRPTRIVIVTDASVPTAVSCGLRPAPWGPC